MANKKRQNGNQKKEGLEKEYQKKNLRKQIKKTIKSTAQEGPRTDYGGRNAI